MPHVCFVYECDLYAWSAPPPPPPPPPPPRTINSIETTTRQATMGGVFDRLRPLPGSMLEWEGLTEAGSVDSMEDLNSVDDTKGEMTILCAGHMKLIFEPIQYAFDFADNELRASIIDALNQWYCLRDEDVDVIKEVMELVLSACLAIDDIEDQSTDRSGQPCTHRIYGIPLTINAANMAYMEALNKALKLGGVEVADIFSAHMLDFHRGQGMEIWWRESYVCPSEDEYSQMIHWKIGSLLKLTAGLMSICASERVPDLSNLLITISRLLQIRNDYANLAVSDDDLRAGGYAEDLSEGKFTFPILHAINHCDGGSRLINILKQRSKDADIKSYCIRLLDDFGSLSYTRDVCFLLEDEVMSIVADLGGNDMLMSLLDNLMGIFKESDSGSREEGVDDVSNNKSNE